MIIDTHAHYDDEQFDADREVLLGMMQENGIGKIVNASAAISSWDSVIELTRRYPFGEIGLDYYWDQESHDVQKKWFVRQLELAEKLGKPVNIHSRDAAADTMEIMREYGKRLRGIIHCYSYSPEMAAEYVKMGYSIGIGGVVTFKNGRKLKETVQKVPIESLVLETDCPYLSPEPNRGKRNSSLNLKYVAAAIAGLKGITPEEVIQITSENAERIYGI